MGVTRRVLHLDVRRVNDDGLYSVEQARDMRPRRSRGLGASIAFAAVAAAALVSQAGKALGDTVHLRAGKSVDNVEVSSSGDGRFIDVPGATALPIGVGKDSIRDVEIKEVQAPSSTAEANDRWVAAMNAVRETEGLPPMTRGEAARELNVRPPTIKRSEPALGDAPLERVPLFSSRSSAPLEPEVSSPGAHDGGQWSAPEYLKYGVLAGAGALLYLFGFSSGWRAHRRSSIIHDSLASFANFRHNMDSVMAHADSLEEMGRVDLALPWWRRVAVDDERRGNRKRLRVIGEKLVKAGCRQEGAGLIAASDLGSE
ncbi:MAG: hypothetical protein V1875_02820 [Candidatus Altiarchaeota archaeon]